MVRRDESAFADAFRAATGFEPYPWQQKLGTRKDPARVIVAETGTGKTEAAVMDWLWRRRLSGEAARQVETPRRLILTLPARVLVEQTIERVEGMLTRLERADLIDPDDPVRVFRLMGGAADDSWVLRPAADQILVGTVDMLLSRALNRGYGRSRAAWPFDFGLINADSHFVLDEVQLLDVAVATSAQLAAFRADASLVGTRLPARTTWMSATLNPQWLETIDHPRPTKDDFAELSREDERGPLQERLRAEKRLLRTEIDPSDARGVADVVHEAHARARRYREGEWLTIAMCNTVARALALHAALEECEPEAELLLLHSRFRPPDREARVARLGGAPPSGGRILVTTQVIEAGMDLDAAALVTELAPWSSVVQRAGRLNRFGRRDHTELMWLDPPSRELPPELAAPYRADELARARSALRDLDGESLFPSSLRERRLRDPDADARLVGAPPPGLLLRRPDLLELFDTDPTLDGDDTDVSPFIRSGEDVDVAIAWRALDGRQPAPDAPAPTQAEVCPVPVRERQQIAKLSSWRWSYARRRWERVSDRRELRPGDVLLVDSERGGYSPEVGWDPSSRKPVSAITPPDSEAPDSDEADSASGGPRWMTIADHTDHVVAALDSDLEQLELPAAWESTLRAAGRLHDAGKAHPRFQERLREWAASAGAPGPPEEGMLWAKAPGKRAGRQRVFRHEVASALLVIEQGVEGADLDLAAYLIGAHHGKLRLAPRVVWDEIPEQPGRATCLGVAEGDRVPQPDADGAQGSIDLGGGVSLPPSPGLDLAVLAIGSRDGQPVWIERTLALLERVGPFNLAYLEALLRAADQRASALERAEGDAALAIERASS